MQVVTGSLEKGGIRCLPVENVPKSIYVQYTPERSNHWKKLISKCNRSIPVHLQLEEKICY